MNTELYHIVYLSASSHLLSDEDLRAILTTSRANNRERGVTGMLLYSEGGFIQALEGPKNEVIDLYRIIGHDPRHGQLTTLLEGPIGERNFPHWTMGYRRVDPNTSEVPGFSRFFDEPSPRSAFRKALPPPLKLLLFFKENSTSPYQGPQQLGGAPGVRLV